jgi:hypothetical protein
MSGVSTPEVNVIDRFAADPNQRSFCPADLAGSHALDPYY